VVLHAIADTSLGEVGLYVTHLTNGEPEINQGQTIGLMDIVELRSSSTAIIAGDFNTKPESAQIQELKTRWIDTYHVSNSGKEGNTCCIHNLTQRDAKLHKRIDYIFLKQEPNELRIKSVQ
jgi:endonuclease/exonuclease/phosphatase family metal-dependent hydrolase